MRWMKWGLVASWLGVHVLLWMSLPPAPFHLNGQMSCVLPWTLQSSYFSSQPCPWSRWDTVSSPHNNFAFVNGGSQLIAGDATSIHIYDLATRQMQQTWEVGVVGRFPENGVRVWGHSADGTYAVVNNGEGAVWLLNLTSGARTELADGWGVHFRAIFVGDPDRRLHRERLLLINGWTLSIVDPEVEGVKKVRLKQMAEVMAVATDGKTAAIGESNDYSGSHRSGELLLGFELIDVSAGKRISLDDFHHSGRWLSCRISPDGRTVAGAVSVRGPPKPGTQMVTEYPRLMTWEVSTGRRLSSIDHAWGCGWCADGRLVVRNEDGDCYFADAKLNRCGNVPTPTRLTDMDDLSADEAGTHLVVKYVRPTGEPLRYVNNWLKPGSGDGFLAHWECFDLGGRKIAAVPGWTGGCDVSSDGLHFAVGSPVGNAVDIYDLPARSLGGPVLALMIVEISLAIIWSIWRRRHNSNRRHRKTTKANVGQ
jgi:hypothetical protein